MKTLVKVAIGIGTALAIGGVSVYLYKKNKKSSENKLFRSITSELQFYDYHDSENLYECALMKVPFGNTVKVNGEYLGEEQIDGNNYLKFKNGDNLSYKVNNETVTPDVCYVRKEDVYEVAEA